MRRRNYALTARLAVLFALLAISSCVGQSTRVSTLSAALVTVDASREAFLAYDKSEQEEIVAKATSLEDGKAKIAAYRGKRTTVEKAFVVAYNAIAVASTLSDDQSLASAKAALAQVVLVVGVLTGGTK